MADPVFLLQIVDRQGQVVRLPAGGQLERDFVEACTDAIVARGVGFWRTEAHVRDAITDGIAAAIRALKDDTIHVV